MDNGMLKALAGSKFMVQHISLHDALIRHRNRRPVVRRVFALVHVNSMHRSVERMFDRGLEGRPLAVLQKLG